MELRLTIAALSLYPIDPDEWFDWHCGEQGLDTVPKREEGETCRHCSLSAALVSRWWVKVVLWFTSVKKLYDGPKVESPSSLFSPPLSPSCYYFSPPLHSSLCPRFLSFLPANCRCTTPFISPSSLQSFSAGQLFSAVSAGPCWETSRMFKTSHTPISTCGPVQPDRGFRCVDDGAQSSFLSPHKSVGGLVLWSNIKAVFHDMLLGRGGKAVVD